jgi:hypothetical protein
MTTDEEKLEEARVLILTVQTKAEEGDQVAELAIELLAYIKSVQDQLRSVSDLVLVQNKTLQFLLETIDTTISMPEIPDNLPGYQ